MGLAVDWMLRCVGTGAEGGLFTATFGRGFEGLVQVVVVLGRVRSEAMRAWVLTDAAGVVCRRPMVVTVLRAGVPGRTVGAATLVGAVGDEDLAATQGV